MSMVPLLLATLSWSLSSCRVMPPYPKMEKCLLQYKVKINYIDTLL